MDKKMTLELFEKIGVQEKVLQDLKLSKNEEDNINELKRLDWINIWDLHH